MKHIILSLIVICFFLSCKKTKAIGGVVMGYTLIRYVDSSGNSLYTDGRNGYIADSIKVYDFNNNKSIISNWAWQDIYLSTIDISSAHFDYKSINRYNKILIHLKQGVEDTIIAHYPNDDITQNYYDSLWYNGIFKSKSSTNGTDTFSIVKHY